MAALINIGYPHLPYDALTSATDNENAAFLHDNLVTGSRSLLWQAGTAVTSNNITYDLGSGNTGQSEYIIVGRADLLTSLGSDVDVDLRASTDNFSASDDSILSDTNITVADLIGPKTQDLLITGSLSTAYRYWRFRLTSSSSYDYICSKVYFGEWFDFTVGPRFPFSIGHTPVRRSFTTDAGTTFMSRGGKPQHAYSIAWDVSDTIADSFTTTIANFWDVHTFWLYVTDDTCTHILGGNELVHVRFTEPPTMSSGSRNRTIINCRFLEEIA